jgi:hypothetical protein
MSALLVVCALSGAEDPNTSAVAYFAPAGPQSFPSDSGIEETRSGCCIHHEREELGDREGQSVLRTLKAIDKLQTVNARETKQ